MFHHVAHSVEPTLLFHTWPEGLRLWKKIVAEVPEILAFVIMPNHLHLLHLVDVRRQLAHAIGSYVRERNARRGTKGLGVKTLPPADPVIGFQKQRRDERYVYLNPTKAGLVKDPLEWPLSTYRDRLGLTAWPVVAVAREPARLHRAVSSDPSVDVKGSLFPTPTLRTDDLLAVLHATSAVTRTPLDQLGRRGPARTLFLRAAAQLCPTAPRAEVAAFVHAKRAAATRAAHTGDPAVRLVSMALADPRFPPLHGRDLRRLSGWDEVRVPEWDPTPSRN
jgi:hypothetical protein